MSKDMNFENAINKLEAAVKALESGELSLDESIAEFEEAVKLVGFEKAYCRSDIGYI